MKQVSYTQLEQARQAGERAFPQARTVRPMYSPQSPTSDYLVEVWDENTGGARVYPVTHNGVVIA